MITTTSEYWIGFAAELRDQHLTYRPFYGFSQWMWAGVDV